MPDSICRKRLVPAPMACVHSAAVCNQFFLVVPGSPITVERQTEPAKEDETLDPVDMLGVEQ